MSLQAAPVNRPYRMVTQYFYTFQFLEFWQDLHFVNRHG